VNHSEIERRIRHYGVRKGRLLHAIQDGAVRVEGRHPSAREQCGICTRRENGGGLVRYLLRDGQELITGDRCAEYLDYLLADPRHAREVLK
jgi:hypothetical protein